jgi:hypothetical protein
MIYLLGGLLLLWLALAGLKSFSRTNPAALARLMKQGGGVAAIVSAILLLLRGRIDMAIGLGSLGAWLLGLGRGSRMFTSLGGSRPPRSSCVRSAMIEMELDHDTGALRGTILAGPDEGRSLDQLTRPQCEALYSLCRRDDPDGARLLEVYLDRRFSGWRTAGQDHADTRSTGPDRRPAAMSEEEAYEVLGLEKGASREEVVRSHRLLMKKLHPDHGGTTALAARVNEAKDVLMRRHP